MKLLHNKLQINNSFHELIRISLSYAESVFTLLICRLESVRGMSVGERLESWDLLTTLNLIETHLQRTSLHPTSATTHLK